MSEAVFQRIDAYCAHLKAASQGAEPAEDFVLALRNLLLALPSGQLPKFGAERLRLLGEMLTPAAMAVAAATAKPDMEEIFFGVACTSGLFWQLGLPPAEREAPILTGARLEQIALLADELDAGVRRARIAKAGDPLRRALRISIARSVERNGAPLN